MQFLTVNHTSIKPGGEMGRRLKGHLTKEIHMANKHVK